MSTERAMAADDGAANGATSVWPARVIIVDSPSRPLRVTDREFRSAGLAVVHRSDSAAALVELGHAEVSAVIAPTDLIGMSIVDFTDVVVSLTRAPVFIGLACDDDHADAVAALDRGARGILPMPLDAPRIADEVRALESVRVHDEPLATELQCGHVQLLSLSHRVLVAGREVHLSPKEFAILESLMRASPRVVRLPELVQVFEAGVPAHLARVRVMIAKIRLRLAEAAPELPDVVHTVRGIGYRVGE